MNKEEKEILDKLNKYDFKKGTPVLMEYEIKNMMAYMNRAEQELERYKNIIDKTVEYVERLTNGKTSRIDTWENVEFVLEMILQILKGE